MNRTGTTYFVGATSVSTSHIAYGYGFMRILCIFLLIVLYPLSLSAKPVGIVVFGDSSTDQGNNYWLEDAGRRGLSRGAPITNWPDFLHENNRGKTWFQYLTNSLYGLDSVTSSNALSDSLFINAAWVEAGTGDDFLDDRIDPPSATNICQMPGVFDGYTCIPGIIKQIALYLDSPVEHKSERLHLIFAGGNDIFDNIKRIKNWVSEEKDRLLLWLSNDVNKIASLLTDKGSKDAKFHQKLEHPIDNTVEAVKRLIAAGVPKKNIVVLNLPDLSRAPVVYKLTKDKSFLRELLKRFCAGYDEVLKAELYLAVGSGVKTLDTYSWLNRVLDERAKNGVSGNAERGCVDDAQQEECSGYFFFNGMHMTTQIGHKLFSQWMVREILALYEESYNTTL